MSAPPTHEPVEATIGPHGYGTAISAAGHDLRADEPVSRGGADTGPDPFALLQSALAACTLITIRMYADRKKWPLAGAQASLQYTRTAPGQGRDRIDMRLSFEGDLSEDQRSRLLEIAGHCPVHKALLAGVDVRTAPDA